MNENQARLNLLFEMENIKSTLMYLGPGAVLKVITDLGAKDSNGNKKRFYEENRYSSTKYKNTDHLISSSLRLDTYLSIEYENPEKKYNQNAFKRQAIIKACGIAHILQASSMIDAMMRKCYEVKDGDLYMIAGAYKEITVHLSYDAVMILCPDIYMYADKEHPSQNCMIKTRGVRVTINDECSFIMSADTTWVEFVYRISKCDLTSLGFQMIQSYMALLPGMAVNDIEGGKYTSSSKYEPYWGWGEDPEDIVRGQNSVGIASKAISNDDKKKEFFNQ